MGLIKKGLTSFRIKTAALIIMTVDHLASYKILTASNDVNDVMRMIGRIAAPLFLFLLVEGLRYTRSRKNYIIRLYIAGAAIQLAGEFLHRILSSAGIGLTAGNILPTLFYTALYITCIDKIVKKAKNIAKAVIFMIVPVLFAFIHLWFLNGGFSDIFFISGKIFLNVVCPSPLTLEYSFIFVLLGVTWYFINNKIVNCVIFALLSVISGIVDYRLIYNLHGFTFWHLFTPTQWCMCFAVIFIALYNGKKGNGRFKYFFYVYYPLHQYLFIILSAFFLKR